MKSDLQVIPGIGKNMAQHPEEIYLKDCVNKGEKVDRCALYVYRLAVHYANHEGVLPQDKQNWWDWKDN